MISEIINLMYYRRPGKHLSNESALKNTYRQQAAVSLSCLCFLFETQQHLYYMGKLCVLRPWIGGWDGTTISIIMRIPEN